MQRLCCSRWFISGVSLAVGTGVGVALSSSSNRFRPEDGLLQRIPVIPMPSVNAASELIPYQHGQLTPSTSTAAVKYGFPSLSHIRSRESYVTCYDSRSRTPAWVIEQLSADALTGTSDRKLCNFKEDDSVHVYHRATNSDYKGSGFDRGHLAAAANHKRSQKAMDDTFYLSNVVPQNPHLNQNAWNNLEKYCRSLTKHYENVYVCSGPLYLPRQEPDGKMYVKYQVIGKNHVAVPTHFFKVVILEKKRGEVELRSYVMPNTPVDEKIPLERFLVPIESIERASGLLFVPNILKRTNSLQAITARV
ncbi:endonuclease G, mitochondrial [Ictalurus furcatus]|uniref:endonuclease G, mitochondrial n=1 Tax=Ictalurus furcatus TaxID=66913 RepID=UPI00235087B1|nr:endonuclease G, mitochondrial [Ictalurus furcatus]